MTTAQPRQSHYKLVDSYVVHGGSTPLAERVAEVVPEEADYVILDLDRTVHLGVTIGERLGWEILCDPACRPHAGAEFERLLPVLSARYPVRTLAALARGVKYWSLPGLVYAGTVRLGDRWAAWDRFLTLTLGSQYVDQVQAVLRSVLMASAAGYTREQLAAYAGRAWRRWQTRLVIDADTVVAIRRRCPRLQAVILSSASTAPTVEHAAGKLGVDGFVSSTVDLYAVDQTAVYSAPVGIPGWLRRGKPRFLSRPGAVVHNSAAKKVDFLRMHYPEVFAPDSTTVAISDNNYGEDRAWPDYFDHVIALNSRHPFSPFVRAASPCKTIQTLDAAPACGSVPPARGFAWHGTLEANALSNGDLLARFSAELQARLESLRDLLRAARSRAAARVDASLRQRVAAVGAELADAVNRYNRSTGKERAAVARDVNRLARTLRRVRWQLERTGRECTRIRHEVELLHAQAARAVVARASAHDSSASAMVEG